MTAIVEHPTIVTKDEPLETQLTLPPEIINTIIDDLGYDASQPASIEALRACALVSRALCMQAYSYLFSEITFSIVPSLFVSDAPKGLLDILVTGLRFPDLGMVYHIRSASFILEMKYHSFIQDTISDKTVLPEIMDALHGPNHGISGLALEIRGGGHGYKRSSTWSDNGTKFNAAFQNLCRSQNLKSLRLKCFKKVPKALLYGTNIKHLTLEDIDAGQSREAIRPEHTDIVQPSSITLLGRSWLPDTVELLLGDANANANYNNRLRLAFSHLTDLTIRAQDQPAYLRQMPRLHSLRLIHLSKYPGKAELVVQNVNRFFSYDENNAPPSLAHLTVEIKALASCFTDLHQMYAQGTRSHAWNTFDSHLAGAQFRSVHDIRLVIHFGYYQEFSFPSHGAMPVAEIKKLYSETFLFLSPCVRLHFCWTLLSTTSTRPARSESQELGSEAPTLDGGSNNGIFLQYL